MDREGFRNRLKQYKQAREENPGLKYWEFIRDNTDENGNIVSTKESPIYTEEYAKEQEQKRYAQKVVDEIKSKQRTFDQERTDTDRAGAIPYISEKSITLTNAGKDTGVTLSTNVLDSIAKYAKNAELSLSSALGLAGQESTFGKGYNAEAKEMLPSTLVSNWNYGNPYGRADRSENPYLGLWNAANKKVNGHQGHYDSNQDFIYDQKFIDVLKGGLPYADKQAKHLRTDIPVLEHAFRKYKLGQYNPNDPNHTRMVEERGKALMKSPEIQKWVKENNIKYAEGGEVIDSRQKVLDRANKVTSNYSDAKDFDLNPFMYAIRKFAKNTIGKGGISNCTLSATGWVDPNNQYMSAINIFDNPNSGYTEIPKEYALPGDLLIAKNPIENTYHTMLIEKFNENDPILRYSRGGHDTEKNLVTGRSLMEYHKLDNEQGGNHTEDHYFRYNFPNEYWLPELVVTGKKK